MANIKKMTKAQRADLDKGFIFVRVYLKGIANGAITYDKEGDDYVNEGPYKADKRIVFKLRYSFNWATLRYRYNVSAYKNGVLDTSNVHDVFGRCENISPEVMQTGN